MSKRDAVFQVHTATLTLLTVLPVSVNTVGAALTATTTTPASVLPVGTASQSTVTVTVNSVRPTQYGMMLTLLLPTVKSVCLTQYSVMLTLPSVKSVCSIQCNMMLTLPTVNSTQYPSYVRLAGPWLTLPTVNLVDSIPDSKKYYVGTFHYHCQCQLSVSDSI